MNNIRENAINEKSKQIAMANSVYYLAVILLTIKTILISSELIVLNEFIDKAIFVICIVLILSKMIMFIGSISGLVLLGVIGVICLYTGVKTGSYHIFISYLIIAGSYKVSMRKMIKCISYTSSIIILIHIVVYLLNMLFGTIEVSSIVKQGEFVSTYSFYLGHSNTASMYILWTILAFIYLNYEKLTLNKSIIYITLMIFNYCFTKSRTGLIISILTIGMIFLDNFILKENSRIFKLLSKYGFAILSIIVCTLCIFYNEFSNVYILDKIFTGRLLLSSFAFNTYGYTLFGQFIDFHINYGNMSNWSITRLAIDIMPLRLLINYGVFYLLLYNIVLFKVSKYTSRKENLFIILMIFYSSMEIFTINVVICFPLAICGWYIVNSKSINKKLINKRIIFKI